MLVTCPLDEFQTGRDEKKNAAAVSALRKLNVKAMSLVVDLRDESAGSRVAERVRDGFEVAIVGAPNIGKSTLLNALAGRDAAITSEMAGTTRDVIEVRMNLSGLPVTLLDTAGLREGLDPVEEIGIARGLARADQADLRVFLLADPDEVLLIAPRQDDVVLLGKGDLRANAVGSVSGTTGSGVDQLIERLVAVLQGRVAGAGVMTRERHRMAMLHAIGAMESALSELQGPSHRGELVAVELRRALQFLDQLVGRVGVEDLLDEIFASFCIGK